MSPVQQETNFNPMGLAIANPKILYNIMLNPIETGLLRLPALFIHNKDYTIGLSDF